MRPSPQFETYLRKSSRSRGRASSSSLVRCLGRRRARQRSCREIRACSSECSGPQPSRMAWGTPVLFHPMGHTLYPDPVYAACGMNTALHRESGTGLPCMESIVRLASLSPA